MAEHKWCWVMPGLGIGLRLNAQAWSCDLPEPLRFIIQGGRPTDCKHLPFLSSLASVNKRLRASLQLLQGQPCTSQDHRTAFEIGLPTIQQPGFLRVNGPYYSLVKTKNKKPVRQLRERTKESSILLSMNIETTPRLVFDPASPNPFTYLGRTASQSSGRSLGI